MGVLIISSAVCFPFVLLGIILLLNDDKKTKTIMH